jgi:hypothetical protein
MKSKRCIDCNTEKPVSAFYRVFKGSPHRQSRCKPCDNRKRAGNVKRSYPGTRLVWTRMPCGTLVSHRVPA